MTGAVSNYWMKLGTVVVPPLPSEIYHAPTVYDVGHTHYNVKNTPDKDFWFYRTEWDPVAVITYTGEASRSYLKSIDFPDIEVAGVSFMTANQSWMWHTDRARTACINIAIQNGPMARIDFEDDTSYIMNTGDVYCLDVTKKHRIVFDKEALPTINDSRIVLTINLKEQFNTEHSQQIFKTIKEYLRK